MCCSQPVPPRKRGMFTLIVAIASGLAGAVCDSRINSKHQELDLETCRLTLDDLGRAIHEGPWVTTSDLIASERSALGELHTRIGELIGRDEAGIAVLELAKLQAGLARLFAKFPGREGRPIAHTSIPGQTRTEPNNAPPGG